MATTNSQQKEQQLLLEQKDILSQSKHKDPILIQKELIDLTFKRKINPLIEYATSPILKNIEAILTVEAINNISTNPFLNNDYFSSRYDDLEVTNLEDIYNANEIRATRLSGWNLIMTGFGRMVGTASTTILDGFVGLGAGIFYGAINPNDNGFWYNFTHNPVTEEMNHWNNTVHDALPIYYYNELIKNQEEGKWWLNMKRAAWWGDFIDNLGFLVAMAITGSVTGRGIHSILNTKNQRRIFSELLDLVKNPLEFKSIFNRSGALNNVLKNLLLNARRLKFKNTVANVTAGTLSAIGESRIEAINGVEQFQKEIILVANQTENDELQKLNQQFNDIDYLKRMGYVDIIKNPDGTESYKINQIGTQAYNDKKQLLKKNIDELKQVSADDIVSMSNAIFAANMAVLSISNTLALFRSIGGGYRFDTSMKGLIKKASNRKIKKEFGLEVLDKVLKLEAETGFSPLRQYIASGNKLALIQSIASPFREGLEEFSLGAISQGTQNKIKGLINKKSSEYLGYKLYNEGLDDAQNMLNAMAMQFNKNLSDPKAYEEFTIGAISSLMPLPFINFRFNVVKDSNGKYKKTEWHFNNEFWKSIGEYKDSKKRALEICDKLNANLDNNIFLLSSIGYLAANRALLIHKSDAIDKEDKFEFLNALTKQLVNLINLYNSGHRIDDLRSVFEYYSRLNELSPAEQDMIVLDLKQSLSSESDPSPYDHLSTKEIIDKITENNTEILEFIDDYVKILDSINGIYGNTLNSDLDQDFVEELAFLTMNAKSLEKRYGEVLNKVINRLDEFGFEDKDLDDEIKQTYKKEYGKEISSIRDLFNEIKNDSTKVFFVLQNKKLFNKITDYINSWIALDPAGGFYGEGVEIYKEIRDLKRISSARTKYINKFLELSNNPLLYTKEFLNFIKTMESERHATPSTGSETSTDTSASTTHDTHETTFDGEDSSTTTITTPPETSIESGIPGSSDEVGSPSTPLTPTGSDDTTEITTDDDYESSSNDDENKDIIKEGEFDNYTFSITDNDEYFSLDFKNTDFAQNFEQWDRMICNESKKLLDIIFLVFEKYPGIPTKSDIMKSDEPLNEFYEGLTYSDILEEIYDLSGGNNALALICNQNHSTNQNSELLFLSLKQALQDYFSLDAKSVTIEEGVEYDLAKQINEDQELPEQLNDDGKVIGSSFVKYNINDARIGRKVQFEFTEDEYKIDSNFESLSFDLINKNRRLLDTFLALRKAYAFQQSGLLYYLQLYYKEKEQNERSLLPVFHTTINVKAVVVDKQMDGTKTVHIDPRHYERGVFVEIPEDFNDYLKKLGFTSTSPSRDIVDILYNNTNLLNNISEYNNGSRWQLIGTIGMNVVGSLAYNILTSFEQETTDGYAAVDHGDSEIYIDGPNDGLEDRLMYISTLYSGKKLFHNGKDAQQFSLATDIPGFYETVEMNNGFINRRVFLAEDSVDALDSDENFFNGGAAGLPGHIWIYSLGCNGKRYPIKARRVKFVNGNTEGHPEFIGCTVEDLKKKKDLHAPTYSLYDCTQGFFKILFDKTKPIKHRNKAISKLSEYFYLTKRFLYGEQLRLKISISDENNIYILNSILKNISKADLDFVNDESIDINNLENLDKKIEAFLRVLAESGCVLLMDIESVSDDNLFENAIYNGWIVFDALSFYSENPGFELVRNPTMLTDEEEVIPSQNSQPVVDYKTINVSILASQNMKVEDTLSYTSYIDVNGKSAIKLLINFLEFNDDKYVVIDQFLTCLVNNTLDDKVLNKEDLNSMMPIEDITELEQYLSKHENLSIIYLFKISDSQNAIVISDKDHSSIFVKLVSSEITQDNTNSTQTLNTDLENIEKHNGSIVLTLFDDTDDPGDLANLVNRMKNNKLDLTNETLIQNALIEDTEVTVDKLNSKNEETSEQIPENNNIEPTQTNTNQKYSESLKKEIWDKIFSLVNENLRFTIEKMIEGLTFKDKDVDKLKAIADSGTIKGLQGLIYRVRCGM